MRLAKIILAACVWAYFVTGLSATLPFSAESSRGGAETRSSTLCGPAALSRKPVLGYQIDVSRCKVPKQEVLYRIVCIDRMEFDADGDIKPIVMTE